MTPTTFPLTLSLTPTFLFFKIILKEEKKKKALPFHSFIVLCLKSWKKLTPPTLNTLFAWSWSIKFLIFFSQNPKVIAFVWFYYLWWAHTHGHFLAVKEHCCRHDPSWLSGTPILALSSVCFPCWVSLFSFSLSLSSFFFLIREN